MKIDTLILSPFQTNCYILSCEKTNEGVVIDPADEGGAESDRPFRGSLYGGIQ